MEYNSMREHDFEGEPEKEQEKEQEIDLESLYAPPSKRKNAANNTGAQRPAAPAKSIFTQRCYTFTVVITKLVKALPDDKAYWTISSQLLKAATAIGTNVVTAKTTNSRNAHIRCYNAALKAANETKYWLSLLRDTLGIDKNKINRLIKENNVLANTLAASLNILREKK